MFAPNTKPSLPDIFLCVFSVFWYIFIKIIPFMDLRKKTLYENERLGLSKPPPKEPERPAPTADALNERFKFVDHASTSSGGFEIVIIVALVVLIAITIMSAAESLGEQDAPGPSPAVATDNSEAVELIDPHEAMPVVGEIRGFQYLWSQNQQIMTGDMAKATSARRAHSMTTTLSLTDGSSISVRGLVPNYAHGATIHSFTTIGGIVSDYCIAAPLNECYEAAEAAVARSGYSH